MFIPPLRWLFRVTGVLPRNSPLDCYFTVLPVVLDSLCVVSLILNYSHTNDLVVPSYGLGAINDLIFCLCSLYFVYKLNSSKRLITSLLDKCLLPEDTDQRYMGTVKRFEMMLTLVLTLAFGLRFPMRYKNSVSVSQVLVYDLSMATNYIHVCLQIVIVRHLGAKFHILNDQLRELSSDSDLCLTRPSDIFKSHVLLRSYRSQVNSYFGVFTGIIVVNRVLYVTLVAYYVLSSLRDPDQSMQPNHIVVFLFALIIIVCQCDAAYRSSEEAKETIRIAHDLMERDSPQELLSEIADFSLTMFNNPVTFTAGGMFNIDRGLITKTTLASVTCLIITIQLTGLQMPKPTTAVYSTEAYDLHTV